MGDPTAQLMFAAAICVNMCQMKSAMREDVVDETKPKKCILQVQP